ncbi:hypothetical protein [Borrelia miyamotoi]|uniref:Uncharacterized protein n=1 Tax=Borrelia miyamotoi TaxID=47466 RepID=A0AAQ2WX29_9SPIR|nr:hypothetical protein [Borrelia miyamotoi]WAZ85820.1 hypothetical protein O5400_05585 [Borrelia miyamotoi]WAZ91602.1 hypothetical protein O5398_05585 [Borrelia miyamotoi]WAZ92894.1 hypothetical protein O5402_05620 [Borrelia miyamotoi]WAZ94185.1 hypothetical protein O5399_05615 [Borrelia miyamotoi]WAZ95616.1 hypothetical protein O5397_06360 [Borrelia miyamotoi]
MYNTSKEILYGTSSTNHYSYQMVLAELIKADIKAINTELDNRIDTIENNLNNKIDNKI